MPFAWFLVPYLVEVNPDGWPKVRRRPAFHPLVAQIVSDGGQWAGSECLGNHVICKIRASDETLDAVAAVSGVIRLPKNLLSDTLSDLTAKQKNVIVNKLQDFGYSVSEIRDALGTNIGTKTLGDILRFAIKRRLTPRWDEAQAAFVLDGEERSTKSIDSTDDEVSSI